MRSFVPSLDAVAAADFTHAGKQYKRGESFPHRELNTLEQRGLWLAHLIDFPTPAVTAPVPAVQAKQQQRR